MERKLQKPRNFGRDVTIKGLIIIGMIILLFIPMFILQGKVREREERRDEAVRKISASWGGPQTVCAPVLTVPFINDALDEKGNVVKTSTSYTLTPEKVDIKADLVPEIRSYGMFEAIVYTGTIDISGEFGPINPALVNPGEPNLAKTYLSMEISDLHGLLNELAFEFDGKEYPAKMGDSREYTSQTGRRDYYDDYRYQTSTITELVVKPEIDDLNRKMPFSCRVELRGSEGMYFVPVGKTTNVQVCSSWPHPSFTGSFSPSHEIGKEGFDAKWSVLHYNRNIPDVWTNKTPSFGDTSFGVNLVTGADEYQQNERAVKYALLFVVLTFVVFFFVEILTYKRIHPIQYLLVAAALMIFYTLLLSISEIVGFGWAYLISALATVALITLYTATIFKDRRETMLLSSILAGLYAYLYFILQLENYTLLVGSVGLFVILGVIMYVSRKVSWYRAEEPEATKE